MSLFAIPDPVPLRQTVWKSGNICYIFVCLSETQLIKAQAKNKFSQLQKHHFDEVCSEE